MRMKDWVRFPTGWIQDGGLKEFRWMGKEGSAGIAALVVLAVIAHHADPDTGTSLLTYDQLGRCSGLSRAKISEGLRVLEAKELLDQKDVGRSQYKISNYDKAKGWAKFPAGRLYNASGEVPVFHDLRMRSRTELSALKLYFLFAAFRSIKTNQAHISYDKIVEYTGLDRSSIKRGLSFLAANGLVHIEHNPSRESQHGFANAYRLAHLDSYAHGGTSNRGMDIFDAIPETSAASDWSNLRLASKL